MNYDVEKMIDMAIAARSNSYAPYSKFKVGSAILTTDGKYHLGCNIENSSYPLSNCAERSALFNLYSNGYSKADIVCMAVVAGCDNPVTPCGGCRQVMAELLDENTPLILANIKRDRIITNIKELLPLSFKLN